MNKNYEIIEIPYEKTDILPGKITKEAGEFSYLALRKACELKGRAIVTAPVAKNALYMAGLMHDIGKVVMADFLVREVDCVQDEREQLGCDHAEIASVILNKWSVAPAIVDAVKTHHDADTDLYGKIVSYANKIDHDKNNAEDYIYQLNKDFPIKDMDILIESIQTCLSECIDGKE